jgi:hypothetical protein
MAEQIESLQMEIADLRARLSALLPDQEIVEGGERSV